MTTENMRKLYYKDTRQRRRIPSTKMPMYRSDMQTFHFFCTISNIPLGKCTEDPFEWGNVALTRDEAMLFARNIRAEHPNKIVRIFVECVEHQHTLEKPELKPFDI